MSDNKFTESLTVYAVGNLTPDRIGGAACLGCRYNTCKNPGVLLQGVTQEAAKLLYEKVEVVAEGKKARVKELETSNAALIKTLSTVRQFIVDGRGFGLVYTPEEDEDDILAVVDNAIQKAKGEKQSRKRGGRDENYC